MSLDDRKWLSVEQAAEHTQTDVEWIMEHIKSGALKSVVTARRKALTGPGKYRRRIDKAKLDALMERLETTEVAGPAPGGEAGAKPAKARPVVKKESLKERLAKEMGR